VEIKLDEDEEGEDDVDDYTLLTKNSTFSTENFFALS
jgi:hypothetical protein